MAPSPLRVSRVLSLILIAATLLAPVAQAAPRMRTFGPLIDDYARYRGQELCRPKPKPGVVAFERIVMRAYPHTRSWGISRACDIGGRSEHKEGRAWDWHVRAWVEGDRETAQDLFRWLFATDKHGNAHANARRLGVMYIQWNRRIWGAWSRRWEVYCVDDRKGRCRNEDGKVVHAHRDHVHFSFSWPGARQNTTFWNPELSYP